MQVTKSSGEKEAFDAKKLCGSLMQAGIKDDVAMNICSRVEQKMSPDVSTGRIYREALRHLLKENIAFAARYSLRRAVGSLGPAGFLFEQYVEALMQAYGYNTKRNVEMEGNCVTHEVDVFAEIDGKKCIIEAKYHNENKTKTHIDSVMYADARLIDIATKHESKKEHYGTHEMWMITNTKFTEKAITYGTCRKMKLIGWNYPPKKNLQDMIVEKKVYPITVLPSVSHFERESFARKQMILAQDVLPYTDTDLIQDFDIPPEIARKIVAEAQELLTD